MKHAPYAIIGAGPAGLMAAEQLASAGHPVRVFDAMPSVARKFLLAGIGGMNITHSEPFSPFLSRYREAAPFLQPYLTALPPDALRAWIHDLGIDTFVGSSGRVFPTDMKAAPLLRAWLSRLKKQGVQFEMKHRWTGLEQQSQGWVWHFTTPTAEESWQFDKVVLALGGASYPRLGSDGAWQEILRPLGVQIHEFKASNCGFELPWSLYIQQRFAGTPLKHIGLSLTNLAGHTESKIGEVVLSQYGLEGSLVYALSAPLRELLLHRSEQAQLHLDWLPHLSADKIRTELSQSKKGDSLSNVLRKKFKLPPLASALLTDCLPQLDKKDPSALAQALKKMPLPAVTATRPIAEAISCAGGIALTAVTDQLMLHALPNVFVAGEMLDWEAPTGGYLLTACFATGFAAGLAALHTDQQG